MLMIGAGRTIWALVREDPPPPESNERFVTMEQLGIDMSKPPVQIDILSNGEIIVDGSKKTLKELRFLVIDWEESGRRLSYYIEPRTLTQSSKIERITDVIIESRLLLHMRDEPQVETVSKP